MYSVTPDTPGRLVRLTISGRVSGREYEEICSLLSEAIGTRRVVDLLCELDESFRGITLPVLWRAARVAVANETNLRRVAVIGGKKSYKWARALVRGFHAETRYFEQTHRSQAMRWLSASNPARSESEGGLFGDASYRTAAFRHDRKKQRK